ncbi:MAG TPA: choice-of-anchor tandem repeat GloVer-containing protein, partial [Tepidisphaeraceae bacterium]|nr:choice-of-anchor tandem repeat GloVer-containing protein [Tepidisphaeraceae bacterium]
MHKRMQRKGKSPSLIGKAAAVAGDHRGVPESRGTGRYAIEAFEQRILLSNYSLSTLGLFGSNQTGERPMSGPTLDAAGNLYGTTSLGGAFGRGTVFEVPHGSSTMTTLASFPKGVGEIGVGYGSGPAPLVRDQSGNLYGLVAGNTIFELPAGSSTIDLLASFGPTLPVQVPSQQLVLDPNGNIYGVFSGSRGGVFELPHGSSAIAVLASFNASTVGYTPEALVEDGSGNLFGTTQNGGSGQRGALYEIPHNSSTITTLVSFDGGINGGSPSGLIFDGGGNLFGITQLGGANATGTVFELPHGGSSIVALAQNGGSSSELNMDPSGNIYYSWSTDFNDMDTGAVLEISHVNYASTTVASFKGEDGPQGIALDGGGNIFGVTTAGGTYGNGTVFRIASGSDAVSTVATFGYVLGSDDLTTPIVDSSGNLLGMTDAQQVPGGEYGTVGGVFEVPSGASSARLA